jgi:hypothetical protein
MNTVNFGTDPYGVEESQLARRMELARMLQAQSMDNQPVYSGGAAVAKALMGALAGYDQGQAEKGQRDLAERKEQGRRSELDAIFQTTGQPNDERSQLARLLAGSQNPNLAQAGLGMILKGPGKVSYQDAGDHISIRDEAGHEVGTMPKGVTPDARFGKETVSAEKKLELSTVPEATKYTQGKEDERQQRTLSTVPASAVYSQGQENQRQQRNLTTVPESTKYVQDQENVRNGNKPLTETQGNATAFGMRAKAANDIFGQLEASGAPVGGVENMLAQNRITNVAAPDWAQKAQQAKMNFMSATLRKESGAAISQSEYDAEDRKYFPQPGDSDAVKQQKAQMRDLAIDTMRVQAGAQGAKNIDHHQKTVVQTGTLNGRKVVKYSDGTVDYAP